MKAPSHPGHPGHPGFILDPLVTEALYVGLRELFHKVENTVDPKAWKDKRHNEGL